MFRTKRLPYLVGILLAVAFSTGETAQRTTPVLSNATRVAMEKAVAAVKPSLVRIHVVTVEYEQGREIKRETIGSGVIITKQGHVITNHHVAGRAKQLLCTLANKEEIEGELVGTDPMTDISVIKLLPPTKRDFPAAEFGDSSKLKVGDHVLAMGSPLAFSQSVTMGVISNTELVMPEEWHETLEIDGEDVGSMVLWIGHDADIYGGNSGGPLVNLEGKIVGINEIRMGLGGAIPSNLARAVADQLIKNGKVRRAWIGLTVQPLLKSSKQKAGVLVGGVIAGSPGEKAGFKAGDIILKVAGKSVSVKYTEELPPFNQLVAGLPIGKEVEVLVLRDGKQIPIKVVPQEREDVEAKQQELKEWGLCASNVTFMKAKELGRTTRAGVLVRSLREGGPANDAKPALNEDDVIVEVDGKPVANLEDLVRLTETIVKGKTEPTPTLVVFERRSERLMTVVKVGIRELKDPGREVSKAWLPVGTQVLTQDLAKALGLEGKTGVRVTRLYPNFNTGLQVGDIIVALDGTEIPASQPEDIEVLPAMIRQYPIGGKPELTVIRDGKEMKLSVELAASPRPPREMKRYQDVNFDFTVRDVAFQDRIDHGWAETEQGVLVDSISEGGWASLGNLMTGDLIRMVDGQAITGVAEFQKIMESVTKRKQKSIVFAVKRGIQELFVELRPTWARLATPTTNKQKPKEEK